MMTLPKVGSPPASAVAAIIVSVIVLDMSVITAVRLSMLWNNPPSYASSSCRNAYTFSQ